MTDTTPRVGAPLLAASQAQKSVTHNEALYQFDAFLCARFIDRTHTAPPSSPADGDTYLIATGGTGVWLGQDGNVAYSADGAWRFYPPFAGLVAYVTAESKLIVWSGSAWVDFASMIATQNLPMVGVNTTADSTNKLSVQSNAVLFSDVATGSGGTGDIRAMLSKQASGNTASFLFQDAFSGRAEIGLTGDDNFHFKVSPDGSTWTDAMDIAATTGAVSIASADINGGTVDNTAIGSAAPSSGAFTTLSASGAVTLSPTGSAVVTINPATLGSINKMTIGATTPESGKFTTAQATTSVTTPTLTSGAASAVTLATSGGTQLTVAHVASAANNLQVAGSASGAAIATLSAIGSDANIDIVMTPKGTGQVRLNTVANGTVATAPSSLGPTGAHTTVQEWFAVKNASGTIRYIPAF
jgi:hypothetical protein